MTPEQSSRKLREGCATNAGCVALPLLTVLIVVSVGAVNRAVSTRLIPPATFDVAFAHVEKTAGYVLLVTGAILCGGMLLIALGRDKSTHLGVVLVLLTLPLAAWIAHAVLYEDFIALAARDGTIRLIHRWPRGDVVLRALDARELENEQVPNTDMQPWKYRLRITANGERYRSEATRDSSRVRRAMLLISREQRLQEIGAAARDGQETARFQAMGKLALVQMELGETASARATAEEALALATRAGDELGVASAHFALGLLDQREQRQRPAEEHYRESLRVRRLRLDSDHPDLHDVVGHYAALLDATGRAGQAREIRGLTAPRTIVSELRRRGLTQEEAEAEVRAMVQARRKKRVNRTE